MGKKRQRKQVGRAAPSLDGLMDDELYEELPLVSPTKKSAKKSKTEKIALTKSKTTARATSGRSTKTANPVIRKGKKGKVIEDDDSDGTFNSVTKKRRIKDTTAEDFLPDDFLSDNASLDECNSDNR